LRKYPWNPSRQYERLITPMFVVLTITI